MPKKSFRTSNSTVLVKRSKFAAINRIKVNSKRQKLILIDETNESNWKFLKSELGYKTDSLFLEYLLNLAQKELNSYRPKKRQTSNENGETVKALNYNINHEKSNDAFGKEIKSTIEDSTDSLENEEKTEICPVEINDSTTKVRTLNVAQEEEPLDEVEIAVKSILTPNEITLKDKSLKLEDDLTTNSETDSAKDLDIVCITLTDRNREDNPDELSAIKELSLYNSTDRSIFSHYRNSSAIEDENCPKSDLKIAIKNKFCSTCNKRHLLGKCPEISNHSNTLKTENVYDFDDNERGIYIEGSSRWCHKLLKTKESNEGEKVHDDGNESDSSSSSLKLIVDTSENRTFAESTLPERLMLRIVDEEHGQSVFSRCVLPKSTQLGPLVGQSVKEMDIPDDFDMQYIWEVNSINTITYVSTKDPETSNWVRFLRPANSRESANLISMVQEGNLYFVTTRDVIEGEELIYWMDDFHSAWSKKKMEKKNCGGCNIQFRHPLYYRKHCMIFHDPSCSLTIRKYHCKVCGLAVLGKEKIMKHAAEMHQGKGAYQCQYCHKFFLRLNYLEMHRTYGCSKNPQRSRPLCDLCGRKFCQPQKLKVHIKRMHSDMAQVLKDFQCKSCLKILGSRAALHRHMKEVHNKDIVGACTCDRCGKMFQNKSNLKIHMLTHSGVKPFKCQQTDCTAAFTTKQCLQFHYKKVHGFTDDFIPKIERSIAYTFDAYSGGIVSEPNQTTSPRFEEKESPVPEQRECGLDLSLVTSPNESLRRKEKPQESVNHPAEDPKVPQQNDPRYLAKFEEFDQSSEYETKDVEPPCKSSKTVIQEPGLESKIIFSKGSKKWVALEPESEKSEERFKIFRHENANASLLVEAAITAAEKDINEKPPEKSPDNLIENPAEIYSINQYVANSPGMIYDSTEKKLEDYGKSKSDFVVPEQKKFPEKTNLNDFLRCSSILRINTSSPVEMPKDYNISSLIRDQEAESFNDIEIQDYRNRDLLEAYKESEAFHEPYRAHELYRSDKLDLYRSEADFRMQEKFEYRDFDLSNETYRNLASNLEKYRSADIYRLRSEGYELGYRELADERDGEAQNLSLKEKSLQYETLEELARIGRDNPGFECLLVGDSAASAGNQSFISAAPRSLHGMLSPRSYHPTYEGESVDLSVPRPSYSSSPIYTLDLTSTRVELPARHLDFRSHLGLSPHRFPNSRLAGLANGAAQMSPTGYGVYSSPYVTPSARHSPTCQFQPYTSLYY